MDGTHRKNVRSLNGNWIHCICFYECNNTYETKRHLLLHWISKDTIQTKQNKNTALFFGYDQLHSPRPILFWFSFFQKWNDFFFIFVRSVYNIFIDSSQSFILMCMKQIFTNDFALFLLLNSMKYEMCVYI